MKQENSNANSGDFNINEKDFRMWVFDRHNPDDSAIFEPVKAPDKNKLIEQIPPEYTEIRDFIASSNTDELVSELTKERKQHRKELEEEYIRENPEKACEVTDNEKQDDADTFDIKSENLRKALIQTYENTDAKISFSSLDYSQIKKDTSNPQRRTVNTADDKTDEDVTDSQLKKYKTANICLIALIFALLIFFVGQRYIERNSTDNISIFSPLTESSTAVSETENSSNTTATAETAIPENTTITAEASLININTATADELQTLEGIGEIKAKRIIEYRETYGKFSSKRDILKISGIGEKTFEKIKDKITVE